MPKFLLQDPRPTKPNFSHASTYHVEHDNFAAQFEQAFEPFVINPVEEEPDVPAFPQFKFKTNLSKRAIGMVRPSGTRRSLAGKTPKANQSKALSVAGALAAGVDGPSFTESENVVFSIVDKIVKYLQVEKCVFVMYDADKNLLQAVSPARGFDLDSIQNYSVSTKGKGLTSKVFSTGKAVILNEGELSRSPLMAADEFLKSQDLRNSISAPLFVEKRDEKKQIVSSETIGVVHVFNKTTPGNFVEHDQDMLEAFCRNSASIFNWAREFREVVYEKQELIQTLDSLYVGMMMIGIDGRIITINPAARTVLGVDEDTPLIGERYESAIDNRTFQDVMTEALGGPEPIEHTGEITAQVGHEERVYQAHCAPMKDHDQKSVTGVLIFLNDITDIRGVDRMKTAFISTVSHELRTPLTAIKGFVATLLDDDAGYYNQATQREFYRIIDTECDRLTRLIDDLLNVSRIEQGRAMQLNLAQVDLPTVVQRVITVQSGLSPANKHTLEHEFPADMPQIEADPDKVDQILTNLVNNAIKYSPRGGIVLVAGGFEPSSGNIHFSVADHGMGIPREHVKRIFERFHRVDNRDNREIGGTGIGLYLVKALVDSHHGTIKVESELGRGSVFTVTLPIQQPVNPGQK